MRDPGSKLAEAVRDALSGYSTHWIAQHEIDDHLITLDHKDEIGLMRTLMALREALDRYDRLTR